MEKQKTTSPHITIRDAINFWKLVTHLGQWSTTLGGPGKKNIDKEEKYPIWLKKADANL